jgi:hypothetical protein
MPTCLPFHARSVCECQLGLVFCLNGVPTAVHHSTDFSRGVFAFPCLAYILLGCGAYLGRIFVRRAYQRSSGVGRTKINIIAQLDAAPGLREVSLASDPSFYTSYRHVCRRFLLVWPSAPRRNIGACAKLRAPVAARSVAVR